jgi:hypothetical protein
MPFGMAKMCEVAGHHARMTDGAQKRRLRSLHLPQR